MKEAEHLTQAEKVDAIYAAMVGDEKLGHEGLVARVAKHDVRLGRLERWYIYMSGAAAMAVILYTIAKDFFKG